MKTIEYANKINWNGTATRMISVYTVEETVFEIGDIINPGFSWTDGGEFTIENQNEFDILFVIKENVDGHKVDYDNEQECDDLICDECYDEKEIIINRNFRVTNFYAYDEETKYAEIEIIAV